MANEHTLVLQKSLPVALTVADGTGINKGTLLKMADPRTASAATALNDIVAGISATEKIASDGRVSVAVIQGPGDEFTVKVCGNVTAGDPIGVSTGEGNNVRSIAAIPNLSPHKRLGWALNTVTNGQTLRYKLDMGGGA